jgi:hypothetical protein
MGTCTDQVPRLPTAPTDSIIIKSARDILRECKRPNEERESLTTIAIALIGSVEYNWSGAGTPSVPIAPGLSLPLDHGDIAVSEDDGRVGPLSEKPGNGEAGTESYPDVELVRRLLSIPWADGVCACSLGGGIKGWADIDKSNQFIHIPNFHFATNLKLIDR